MKNVLDLETSSISGNLADGFALEPWRVRQGKAFIDSLHYRSADGSRVVEIKRPTKPQLIEFLESIRGQEVWCWNTVFDVAWLIASIEPNKMAPVPDCIRDIRWRDGLLLAKWILNGQRVNRVHYSFSLANVVSDALRDEEGVQKFVDFKNGAPMTTDSKYWSIRGQLDCIWTQKLINKIWPRLAESQHCGFVIEAANIPFIANSWLIGLRVNTKKLAQLDADIDAENAEIARQVDFPITVVSSPKQMQWLLFEKLGMPKQKTTASGAASTDVETLKLIHYELVLQNDPRQHLMAQIMKLKNNATVKSKYVKTVYEALSRTGDGYMYPVPMMFGTDTGRFTYSNTTGYRGPKVSFAAHQIPRKEKRVRDYVEWEDEWISEYDASGQESRLMAIWSQDPTLVDIFQNGRDFHSMTACKLTGHAYDDFKRMVDAEDAQAIEYRQMGKLGNLSCNYRISGPALSRQAFVKYDMPISIPTGFQIVNTFKSTYRGIPDYWQRAIDFSRNSGYATTATDRRFQLDDWSKAWPAEQTAISHPIQGTGAEHKLIALATVSKKIKEARFILDLHDASFFLAPSKECHDEIGHVLNTIDYRDVWSQCHVNIPLPFEGKIGRSFKDVK